MKKVISFIVDNQQSIIRFSLVFLSVILILFWLPKGGKFKYGFTEGEPWRHDDLKAPYDFAIKKSDEELSQEKNQALEKFYPYYQLNTYKFKEQRFQFIKEFNKQFDTNVSLKSKHSSKNKLIKNEYNRVDDSLLQIKLGLAVLEKIYSIGIIQLADEHKDLLINELNLLSGNIAEKRKVNSFFTLLGSKQFITDTLKVILDKNTSFLISLLKKRIDYNVIYDDAFTQKRKTELLESIALTKGMVQEDENIISNGWIVSDEKYQILISLRDEYEKTTGGIKQYYITTIGYFILISLFLSLLLISLYLFQKDIYLNNKKLVFILFIIVLMVYCMGWIGKMNPASLYVVPFCIVPIVIRSFFNTRVALNTTLATVLITSFIAPSSFEFLFLHLLAGLVAIYTNIRLHYWSQFFVSIAVIFITYFVGYFGISLVENTSLDQVKWANFGWLTVNVLLTLLAYPLIPLFEKIFGLLSEITLFELSDLNKPLLKDLSIKAPGTFQHSLNVANLAEAASYEIGGNPLAARAGALYHDIGKMDSAMYFIENQGPGYNPHDKLPFEKSAEIIIAHVIKGLEIANKRRLPEIIIDFIQTHHGASRVEYFYQSYLRNYPEKFIDESKFRYPGPVPFSKETGVVMLADSVEAASKSIKDLSEQNIDDLVEKIFNQKIEQEQLVHCDITFKEITVIKKLFKKMLKSIYHARIAYPQDSLS